MGLPPASSRPSSEARSLEARSPKARTTEAPTPEVGSLEARSPSMTPRVSLSPMLADDASPVVSVSSTPSSSSPSPPPIPDPMCPHARNKSGIVRRLERTDGTVVWIAACLANAHADPTVEPPTFLGCSEYSALACCHGR
jgi:hypothetical protein